MFVYACVCLLTHSKSYIANGLWTDGYWEQWFIGARQCDIRSNRALFFFFCSHWGIFSVCAHSPHLSWKLMLVYEWHMVIPIKYPIDELSFVVKTLSPHVNLCIPSRTTRPDTKLEAIIARTHVDRGKADKHIKYNQQIREYRLADLSQPPPTDTLPIKLRQIASEYTHKKRARPTHEAYLKTRSNRWC